MARIDIDIEDYLDEVSVYYLLKEIQSRKKRLSDSEKKEVAELCSEFSKSEQEIDIIKTLHDSQKFDAFKLGFRNKTVEEIEKFFVG